MNGKWTVPEKNQVFPSSPFAAETMQRYPEITRKGIFGMIQRVALVHKDRPLGVSSEFYEEPFSPVQVEWIKNLVEQIYLQKGHAGQSADSRAWTNAMYRQGYGSFHPLDQEVLSLGCTLAAFGRRSEGGLGGTTGLQPTAIDGSSNDERWKRSKENIKKLENLWDANYKQNKKVFNFEEVFRSDPLTSRVLNTTPSRPMSGIEGNPFTNPGPTQPNSFSPRGGFPSHGSGNMYGSQPSDGSNPGNQSGGLNNSNPYRPSNSNPYSGYPQGGLNNVNTVSGNQHGGLNHASPYPGNPLGGRNNGNPYGPSNGNTYSGYPQGGLNNVNPVSGNQQGGFDHANPYPGNTLGNPSGPPSPGNSLGGPSKNNFQPSGNPYGSQLSGPNSPRPSNDIKSSPDKFGVKFPTTPSVDPNTRVQQRPSTSGGPSQTKPGSHQPGKPLVGNFSFPVRK